MNHFLDYAIVILSISIFSTVTYYVYKGYKSNKKDK